jgi:copper chaperone CopZ
MEGGTNMATLTVVAPDIHCDGCARSIERSLGKLAGVDSVSVDVAARSVTVTYDERAVGRERIVARLDAAGFPVVAS